MLSRPWSCSSSAVAGPASTAAPSQRDNPVSGCPSAVCLAACLPSRGQRDTDRSRGWMACSGSRRLVRDIDCSLRDHGHPIGLPRGKEVGCREQASRARGSRSHRSAGCAQAPHSLCCKVETERETLGNHHNLARDHIRPALLRPSPFLFSFFFFSKPHNNKNQFLFFPFSPLLFSTFTELCSANSQINFQKIILTIACWSCYCPPFPN